jgi:DNA-binding winged helix-turn-helix (wHTH) protein
MSLAGPHPLLLQIAGYHAFAAHGGNGLPLDAERRLTVMRAFASEAQAHWAYFWRDLCPEEQRLLVLLAAPGFSDPAGVQRLQQRGLVVTREGLSYPLSSAFQEFLARQPVEGIIQAPPVTIEVAARTVLLRGTPLQLSPTEFSLLTCLASQPGKVLTREQLDAELWKEAHVIDSDFERLKAAVKQLRRTFGQEASCIENERGVGYRFMPAASQYLP